MTENKPVRAIVERSDVNVLAPHSTKSIMDEMVLAIFEKARAQSLSVTGNFEGWTEPSLFAGHLIFVAKAAVLPFDEAGHTRWLKTSEALCIQPNRTDFVYSEPNSDLPMCVECTMRLASMNNMS